MKTENKVIVLSILYGLLVWVIDASVDSLIFHKGTFWSLLIIEVTGHELYFRSLFLVSIAVFGIIVSRIMAGRRQAEGALRESETKYRTLLENLPQKIFHKDKDSIYVSCNENYARDLKIKAEEIRGKTDYEFFPWELAEKYGADDKRIIASGETEEIEEKYIHDGQQRWVHTVKTPVKDEKGNITGVLGIFWDITKRERAEKALRESEERYRSVFEGAAEGIVIADIETKEWKYVNPAICKMLGYTEEELKGKGLPDIHPKEDLEYVISEFEAQARGEKTLAPDIPCLRKDGTIMYADINTTKLFMDGRACNIGLFTDITERKRAQQSLKEYSERLEEMVWARTKELQETQDQLVRQEKLTVLGQLAGGLGHELRNPLGAIRNTAYFLNMAIEQPEPEVKEALEILEKEVAVSERVISSLLDFARPKPPTRLEVDINQLVQEALSRVSVPENVEVVNQLNGKLPPLLIDPDQFSQVFGNLILNAIQAMREGGRLIIKSEAPSPDWVTVSITDTGTGIDKETLGKVFEPLFTTKARGIGLGLALTKILVEAHGGTIEVESEVGKGSMFRVKLPVG